MTQERKEGKDTVWSLRSWTIKCFMTSSYVVSVVFLPSSRNPSTGPPRTPIILRLFQPTSSFWVDFVFLFTHKKNTVQDSSCLQVLSRYETQSAANTPLPAPRFLPLCQHHIHMTLKTIRPIESRKRDVKKKHYFPGHFGGWDQVFFGIEN